MTRGAISIYAADSRRLHTVFGWHFSANRFDSAIEPVTSCAQFAAIKPAAFSPSLQTIKGRNYLKRPLRGSGAVADYNVSPTTAPLFLPLMRQSLYIRPVCKRLFREISRAALHGTFFFFYFRRKIRIKRRINDS